MLVNTLKWRRDFKVEELKVEDFPQDVFGNLGHIYGKDKEGRPVKSVRYKNVQRTPC